ncbi:MAG: alanine--tRNA ligase [Marinilabiliales bacterium]|nr:MAG: alanine--tRNA ligase [Marinilabiliales bacterium]
MTSSDIRKAFLDFFKSKNHSIVASAPMVVKDDPSLMFTNAGMNQFKDLFLGNAPIKSPRVADTQKCLRVSGKHNDLEEVGHDTYHHTMFEMLGNWSFGDPERKSGGYFKKEAIEWAWEFLTDVLKIDKKSLFVTVFEGDKDDNLSMDEESLVHWKNIVPEDQILFGSKKDNFWEMGDTGPCGPCSEIHVDIRSEQEKKKTSGRELVNMDHPLVIEVWNLVFIEFNRLASGKLENLKAKHVDTGMGFERLCMVMQGVQSNYDTDVFTPLLKRIADLSGLKYGENEDKDIAMRVIADHLRAVSFAIADGQLPSNTGAGYVIRRILRRAVRYGYTFLDFSAPFMTKLLDVLNEMMGDVFPELIKQSEIIEKVIYEEEASFLRTLEQGIRRFDNYLKTASGKTIDGDFAFELFDTFGFPIDLTRLMAKEKGYDVDMEGFNKGLEAQKKRSRSAANIDAGDWIELADSTSETEFVGYAQLSCKAKIQKYRSVVSKKKTIFELVLDQTPFYAESGGQVGDSGKLVSKNESIDIFDTKKENNLWVHMANKLPEQLEAEFVATVNIEKREATAKNHTATHLLHAALKIVLGDHVEQKGSLVDSQKLRFDFSHFSKMTEEEIKTVEDIVNRKIRENISSDIKSDIPMTQAIESGATALFGEKYGDFVRVVTFDPEYSIELCGGTHIKATGELGLMKITSEGGIAAGVRRIEAVTAENAVKLVHEKFDTLEELKTLVKNPADIIGTVSNLLEQNNIMRKQLEKLQSESAQNLSKNLIAKAVEINGKKFISAKVDVDAGQLKDIAHKLRISSDDIVVVLAAESCDKVNLVVALSDELVKSSQLNASNIIRNISSFIKGGGGGQPHLAMAGGKDASGIDAAFSAARKLL